jgi:hypothetical protein
MILAGQNITLDAKGMPISINSLCSGMKQPDEQSVGAFDAKKNVVYFFDNVTGNLAQYKYSDGSYDTDITLHLERKREMT